MTPCKITPKLLQELIRYEPDTGRMFWKVRDAKYFANPTNAFIWNADKPGKEIAFKSAPLGYRSIIIFGQGFPAHRAAWAIHYGAWPAASIDHINGQKRDNRICNLREAGSVLNGRNMVLSSANTSGHIGVRKTVGGKWSAHILRQRLGTYDSFEEAVKARQEAQSTTPGFTDRHGTPRIVNLGYAHLKLPRLARKAAAKAKIEEEKANWLNANYAKR